MGTLGLRLWRAIWTGLLIASIFFIVYALVDFFIAGSDMPRLRRGPHVWLYYWPTVFWSHGDNLKDKDEIATFLINLFVYSVVAYMIARLRKKSLPNGIQTNVVE